MAATWREARGNAREPDGTMCRDARLPWVMVSEKKLHFSDEWLVISPKNMYKYRTG